MKWSSSQFIFTNLVVLLVLYLIYNTYLQMQEKEEIQIRKYNTRNEVSLLRNTKTSFNEFKDFLIQT